MPSLPEIPRPVLDSDTVLYITDPEITASYALDIVANPADGSATILDQNGEKIYVFEKTEELKSTEKQKGNKWTRRRARRQEQRMIINSGATSHFVSEEMNLPQEGKSNKQVYLPNDATLRTSTKTKLPFPSLSEAAREADILPGLKRSLMSVNKMVEEGYTTIFHPGEEGADCRFLRQVQDCGYGQILYCNQW